MTALFRGGKGWRALLPDIAAAAILAMVALLVAHLAVPISQWGVMTMPGDAAVFTYILAWGAHALFHFPWRYYDVPLFYPGQNMLPGTDGLELQALIVSPIWYLSKNPVLTYNVATFLSHLFCLLAAYYAVRVVLGVQRAWCLLLAVFFAICSDRFWHGAGHMNLLWSGILPIIFAQAWAWLEHGRRRDVIVLGLAMGLSVYFSVYMFVLGSMAAMAGVALWLVSRLIIPGKKRVLLLGAAAVAALVIAAPKILVYKAASGRSTQSRSSLLQASYYSASIDGYAQPTYRPQRLESFWYKVLPEPKQVRQTDEDQQFLGYLLGLLLLAEIVRLGCNIARRRFDMWDRLSVSALVVCAGLVLCSFGPQFKLPPGFSPYVVLHKMFLQFTGFYRVPARLAFLVQWIAILPVGVLLMQARNISGPYRHAYSGIGILLVLLEHAPAKRPFQVELERLTLFDKMDELDPTGKQPFVALDPELSVTYCTLSNAGHWRPAVNGWLGSPLGKEFDQLAGEFKFFPTTRTVNWLAKNGVKWIVVVDTAQKLKAEGDERLQLVDSAQGITLMTLRDPEALLENIRLETLSWKEILAGQRAKLPDSVAWPGGEMVLPVAGDALQQTEAGVVVQTMENAIASVIFDVKQQTATGAWDEIELRYRLAEPSGHNAKLYWKTATDALSEERSVEGVAEAGSDGVWTAKIRPGGNPLWFTDKSLVRLRFDFHSFVNMKPATVEILSVKLSHDSDAAPDMQLN